MRGVKKKKIEKKKKVEKNTKKKKKTVKNLRRAPPTVTVRFAARPGGIFFAVEK